MEISRVHRATCWELLMRFLLLFPFGEYEKNSLLKALHFSYFQRFTEPQLIDQSVYILIAVGGLMFFLGFLGYCGAIRESQCMLSLVSLLWTDDIQLSDRSDCRSCFLVANDRGILSEKNFVMQIPNSSFIVLFTRLRRKFNFDVILCRVWKQIFDPIPMRWNLDSSELMAFAFLCFCALKFNWWSNSLLPF